MQSVKRPRWLIRTVCAALAVTLLAGGIGPGTIVTAKSRKTASPRLLQQFSSSASITISSLQQSNPSQILVSGFITDVADVDVSLFNLTHSKPGDLDVLLVGPGGQTALILSDVGSSASNVTLTLDDQAASQVSSSGPLTSGTFQPTNFSSATDNFFPPAPGTPGSGSELGVFNSTDPNGIWTLYVKDGGGGTGAIAGGWSLRITSANGVPNAEPDTFQAQAGKSLSVDASGVLENDRDPDEDTLNAVLAGPPKKGKVDLSANGAFTYRAAKKAKGTDSFTYLAKDPTGLTDLETVTIQVKKAKKKKGKK